MTFRSRLQVCLGIAAFTLLLPAPGVAKPARSVEMTWNMTSADDQRLTIVVTTTDTTQKPVTITGTAAHSFVLRPEDRVVIVLKWQGETTTGDIGYAVTGTNLDLKDLENLKKLLTGATPAAAKDTGKSVLGAAEETRSVAKAVTDDLTAGGKLTVTFTLKGKEGSGANQKEVTLYTSGGLTFRIESRPPRLTVSTGLALSTAPEPTVAIVKTSNLISFEKDGKTQQAYEQVITLRDNDTGVQPIQAAVSFANFRLIGHAYATLGVQLNQKIFEEPMAGFTYRHPLTGSMGVNFTVGLHFSRETEILESSGFVEGMKVDPTVGLTADDIPVEKKYHRRVMFAFTVDF